MSAPSDWFEAEGEESATPTGSRTEDVKNKIRGGKKQTAEVNQPAVPDDDPQDDALRGLERDRTSPHQDGVPEAYAKLAERRCSARRISTNSLRRPT